MKVTVKGEPYEILDIEVNKRLYPNSNDYSDRNFLGVTVNANVHGFSALFSCNIRADEILIWVQELDAFINHKTGEIVLVNMEDNLEINIKSDLSGHILWSCKIRKDSESHSPILHFTIETAMTIANEMQIGLKQILSQYPVLGTPD